MDTWAPPWSDKRFGIRIQEEWENPVPLLNETPLLRFCSIAKRFPGVTALQE